LLLFLFCCFCCCCFCCCPFVLCNAIQIKKTAMVISCQLR
jgi:hypothetical protein